jgi:predicted DNA repair protein MutK
VRHGLSQFDAAAHGDDVNILGRALQEDVANVAADDIALSAQAVCFFLNDAKDWHLKVA